MNSKSDKSWLFGLGLLILLVIIGIGIYTTVLGPGTINRGNEVEIETISIEQKNIEISVGESMVLLTEISPKNSKSNITWESSDNNIATVKDGKIEAVSEGIVIITAKVNDDIKDECTVTVKNEIVGKNEAKAINISLDKSRVSLYVNEYAILKATISPSNATYDTIKWSSSDPTIVSVENGEIKGLKEGISTIYATIGNNITATCIVTVIPVKVSKIEFKSKEESIVVGGETTLAISFTPENVTDKTIKWSSSDTSIATVKDGKVTGIRIGTVTISAKMGDISCSATVHVVSTSIPIEKISISPNEVTTVIDKPVNLTTIITPSNATNKSVSWSSSDTSIATVDNNGLVIPKKKGIVNITAKAGGKSATIKIIINPIEVTNVELNKSSLTITEGNSSTLVATIFPSNASNKDITWTTSDDKIATVSTSGVVKAKKPGTITITAKSNNGKKANCIVTVTAKPINKIYFLKTGDADSIIIESNGHYGLVDAAINGKQTVEYLNKLGAKHLDFVIATHNHGDHVGGMPKVANSGFIDSSTIYYYRNNDSIDSAPSGTNAYNAVKAKGAQMKEVTNKYPTFNLGDFKIEILNTEKASSDEKNPAGKVAGDNKNSLVAYVTYNGKYGTLLAGDMESQDEYRFVSKLSSRPVDVLKVAHHSWQSSTTMKFTKAIKPKYAIVTSTYLLDDISTPVYYMQQKYGTKFYLTQSSDDAIVVDYSSSLSVSPSKSLVSNYSIKKTTGNWRQLQNGIWFYLKDGSSLDSVVYDEWIKDAGKWYYLGLQGNMMAGWIEVEYKGKPELFYLDKSGKMLTGWQQAKGYSPYNNDKSEYYYSYMYSHVNGVIDAWYRYSSTWANGSNWFYFDPTTGVMYHDKTVTIDGKSYTFNKNGICTNC